MATVTATSTSQRGESSKGSGKASVSDEWADYVPQSVDREDELSTARVSEVWSAVYAEAGLSSGTEKEKKAARCGVYLYGLLNGTSRAGRYNGLIQTSTGVVFEAAAVPRAAGKFNVRRFYRGNMTESYEFLKYSGAVQQQKKFLALAAERGVDAEHAFALADWLTGCPLFTPVEASVHNKAFEFNIQRARRARGGRSLEEVEFEGEHAQLKAQGTESGPADEW